MQKCRPTLCAGPCEPVPMNRAQTRKISRIEQVDKTHAAVLSGLHAASFEDPWSAAAIAAMFDVPGLIALLATQRDAPEGFLLARFVAGEAEILSIGVLPAARGSGTGMALLDRLHALVREKTSAPGLLLDVAADNQPALALYAKAGYKQVGRRKAYYRKPNGVFVDSLTMRRDFA